ncbi:MAG: response regulator [Candidatus Omnitrophota bacterium]
MAKKKILLIDDEPQLVNVVKTRLEDKNYHVITAFDGEEGLRKVKEELPDLIVVDIIMPNMDGYTFVKELRADSQTKQIPVIVLTGRDKMKDLFEIEGIKDYVVKPFEGDKLLEKIEKYL